jgi:hypothetical protein
MQRCWTGKPARYQRQNFLFESNDKAKVPGAAALVVGMMVARVRKLSA